MKLSKLTVDNIVESNYNVYKPLEEFYSNSTIRNVLYRIKEECSTLVDLLDSTPYFSEIHLNNLKVNSKFDKETCEMLFQYYMLSVLSEYLKLSDRDDMINMFNDENDVAEQLELGENMDMRDLNPNAVEGDRHMLKTSVCRLLYKYLDIIQTHKDSMDVSYTTT